MTETGASESFSVGRSSCMHPRVVEIRQGYTGIGCRFCLACGDEERVCDGGASAEYVRILGPVVRMIRCQDLDAYEGTRETFKRVRMFPREFSQNGYWLADPRHVRGTD